MNARHLPAAILLTAAVLSTWPAAARGQQPDREGIEFFERRIRPILAERCFECHGPVKKPKGGLRLDSRAALLHGGDTGPAIAPGEPERSLLVRAIRYAERDFRMPPKGRLSDEQIADLTEWIRRGAPWPDGAAAKGVAPSKDFDLAKRRDFWSLRPVTRPALPVVKQADWPRSPIDYFLLAKLEGAGLRPAAPADRHTLLRRVTFNLTGLPPTPAEVEAFVNDRSPEAFAKVVDRLLASPHYGGRWGRHWLDLVRFAETGGHEFDFELPEAFRYRDYVIRAFNADVPYDQFVREHIAGDLLPAPRHNPAERFNESILGTGFYYLGESKHSPVDVRGDQADRIDNQIDVISKTFLGTTVACARCHDHMFDAVSQRDYYALAGFLQTGRYQRAFIDDPAPTRAKVRELEALRAQILELVGPGPAAPPIPPSAGFADFRGGGFNGWFVSGEAFGTVPSGPGAALLQPDPRRPVRSWIAPGVAHSGLVSGRLQGVLRSPTFTIDKKRIHYYAVGQQGRVNLILDGLLHLRDPIYGGLTHKIDNAERLQWRTIDVSMWQGHRAYLEVVDDGPGFVGVQQVVFSDDGPPPASDPGGQPGPGSREEDRERVAALLKRYREIEETIPEPRRAMAMQEGSPVDERLHIRGSHKNLGPVVPRRMLEVFAGPTSPAVNPRLDLAQRLTDPANPLVARVMVNRIWKHHFGEGIVRTPDDFGRLGQAPTHPELLEWLASEFVRRGWSIKEMHRLILLSSAYQMASRPQPGAMKIDPQNRLLHCMPVRRLEAEAIRDALLAVSGRLDTRMEGKGVLPHLTPFMLGRGRPGASGPLDGDGRRSLYVNVRRNFLTPLFLAFDYPVPFSTMGRRSVSNVPAQAPTMMNNPLVLQQADVWARRVLAAPGTAEERVRGMYLTGFARPPAAEELADCLAFVREQAQAYGRSDDPRAWADLAHVLFNAKEFIYVP
jgi:hypothetical protein